MLRLRVPHLGPCKKRSIQHRGPQRPHHKRQNDAVTAVLQVVAKQKLSNNPLHSSIARPQWLSMGACGPLGPFTTLCIFKSLLNTPKNARRSPGDPCAQRKPCPCRYPHRHFAALTFLNAPPLRSHTEPPLSYPPAFRKSKCQKIRFFDSVLYNPPFVGTIQRVRKQKGLIRVV